MMPREIDVCAAVIRRGQSVLLATRPPGTHLSGVWEFPGGKVAPGESMEECIRRELAEELGLQVLSARQIATIRHQYPAKTVILHFLECSIDRGAQPVGHEGQQIQWVTVEGLDRIDMAPADRVFVQQWLGRNDHPPKTP